MEIKQRWNNRKMKCLLCKKKLVAKEKYLCKNCKNNLGIVGEVTALAVLTYLIKEGLKTNKNIKA